MRLRVLLGIVAVLALLPSVVQSQSPPPSPTPQFVPGVRGSGNGKLDSFLNDLAVKARTQDASSVARSAPTSKLSSVGVQIHLQPGTTGFEARLASLGGIAANIVGSEVEAYVPVTLLESLASLQGVSSVRTLIPPQPDLYTSEGAALHNTPNWNAYGFTGAGVKVGVIDVGFVGYTSRQAEGEVPAPAAFRCYSGVGTFSISVRTSCETSSIHGVAVSETIIDEAPNATLYIANPFTQGDLLATIQWMAAQGVQVINHSVSWTWDGPGDGTSIYLTSPLKSIEAAEAAGILWVNSAGNSAQQVWTGPWTDATSNNFLDYAPGVDDQFITLSAGQQVVLQLRWSDTWGAAARDLDLLLYRDVNGSLVAASTLDQAGGANKDPYEFIVYTVPSGQGGTYRIRVGQVAGTDPPQVQLNVFNQASNLSTQTFDHSIANPAESASPAMLAVGAAYWGTPTTIETYSSRGPTNDDRIKPDITGADCGETATYVTFCGTSQASPHITGLAALIMQRYPNLSATQVADQLKAWSIDRGTPGDDNTWGAGFAELQNVDGALAFTQQPSNGFDGVPLGAQPTVAIQDSNGVTNASDNTTEVTLSVSGTGSPTITCNGGETKTVTSGIAAFSGCIVSPPGTGYTLVAAPSCACLSTTSSAFTISEGSTKLTFTTSPSNGIAGVNLASQPVVAVRNSSNTTITADNATQVTLSSVPSGISCTSGLTLTVTNGVASFGGCQFAATGFYTLHAASNPVLTAADSSGITITGPPAKLSFIAEPTNAGATSPFAGQPVIAILDASDNVVVADQASVVTLTLNAPSSGGPGVLSCTNGLTRTVVNGVATFAGCSVNAAGVAYSVAAASGALTGDTSANFSIFGAPTNLAFSQVPAAGASGQAFPLQPTVVVRDSLGTTVTTSTATVTLSLASGGGPGALSCSGGQAKASVAGVATFSGCSISAAGAYQVHATASGLTAADTPAFNVTGVGPATNLTFTQEPGYGVAGQPFPTQPVVGIRDAADAFVVSDNTTLVTLAKLSGPGALTCDNLSVTASAGLATFSGCTVSQPGNYVLRATATGLANATTASFTGLTSVGTEWYFAEGFTGLGWNTELHLLNPTAVDSTVTVSYLLDSGSPVDREVIVPAERKLVLVANDLADGPGPDVAFGVHITADVPIVAEEQMYAGASGDYAHGTQGATALSPDWYFAEGYTQFGWQTFVLVANPGIVDQTVTVTYQIQGGSAVQVQATVPSGARHTFEGHLDVPDQAFSVHVHSTGPVVAEMAMYDPGRAIAHRAVGVTSPSTSWYLGEGFTGFGWETYISVGNPSNSDATIDATFTIDGESPVTRSIVVPANSRGTFIAQDLLTGVGAGKAFGVHVSANVPIVVQEVLIDPANGASRANSTMAAPALATQWSFSGGSSHDGLVSFLTVSNPGASPVTVTATYYFDDATQPITQVLVVAAESRNTFSSSDGIPVNKRFGVVLTSVGGPIVAQEAVYDEPLVRAFSAGGAPGP
ncbi:MAG: S8 family serine peptidase [Dehalococcoidia bacterium]